MRKRKIDLGGCKLILKNGQAPRIKMTRSKRKELSKVMDGGLALADRGIKVAGRGLKRMAAEMPAVRRNVKKGGKRLTRKIDKGLK